MQLMIGAVVVFWVMVTTNGAAVSSKEEIKSRQKRSQIEYQLGSPLDQAPNTKPCGQEHLTDEVWFMGCQTCGCTNDNLMVCTLRNCIAPMQRRRRRRNTLGNFRSVVGGKTMSNDGMRIRVPYSHCHGHLQEDVYHIGCNVCKCEVGGIELCQMKKCPRSRRSISEVYDENYTRVSETACNQASNGKHISDGCHLCKCTNYGLMCTRNWCPTIEIDYKK